MDALQNYGQVSYLQNSLLCNQTESILTGENITTTLIY